MVKPQPRTGAYCIQNLVNGKVYVGGAYTCLKRRMARHLEDLKNGCHWNKHLLNSWRKHGASNFKFIVLERCSADDVQETEQYWIDNLDACNQDCGYNRCPTAGSSLGMRHTEESKARMSERQKERFLRDGTEQCKKGAKTRREKPGYLEGESERLKALWENPEWRANQVAKRIGKKQSEETKRKKGDKHREKWADPEWRAKTVEGQRQAGYKVSLALTGRKRSPESVAKQRETIRRKKLEQNGRNK